MRSRGPDKGSRRHGQIRVRNLVLAPPIDGSKKQPRIDREPGRQGLDVRLGPLSPAVRNIEMAEG